MASKTAASQNAKPTAKRTTAATRPNRGRRPAVRRVQSPPSEFERILRENLHWLILCLAAIFVGVVLFIGYQKAVASSVFDVRRIDVSGASHTKPEAIEKTVRALSGESGVWNADLTEIKRQLEQSRWIKSAIVSRVLPDGLRVRVTEREPKAVVQLLSGARVWVDDEARILGDVAGDEKNLLLILQGWNESEDADAAKKNQARIKLYLRLQNELQTVELLHRITAVNLTDLQDVVVISEQNSQRIDVNVGNQNFTERFKTALATIAQREELKNAERIKVINYDGHPVVSFKTSEQRNDIPTVNNGNQKRSLR